LYSLKDVKVNSKDVAFLAKELELDNIKATTLLRQNGADVQKAIRAYINC